MTDLPASPASFPSTEDAQPSSRGIEKKKPARETNFSQSEDIGLAEAWLYVSENSVVGTEQGDDFYRAVIAADNVKYELRNREPRSMESVGKRVAIIKEHYVRFSACVIRFKRQKSTGTSLDEIMKMATTIFIDVDMKSVSDDAGPPFRFLHCWSELRHHSKCGSDLEPKAASNASTPTKDAEDNGGAVVLDRHCFRK